MTLYRLLSRVFPKSFGAKLWVAALAGTLVPLGGIAAVGLWARDGVEPRLLIWIAAAVVMGAALSALALRALLAPVYLLAEAVDLWGRTGQARTLPSQYRDELGLLMRRGNRLMARVPHPPRFARREAEIDALTGALNRRGIRRMMREAPAGWMMSIRLDQEAAIDAELGPFGREGILRDAAQLWSALLRWEDVLGRWDEGDFLVFLPGTPDDIAERVAERLRRELARTLKAGRGAVTASFGLAPYPGAQEALPDTIAAARAERERAEAAGGNRIRSASGNQAAA